MTFEEIRSNYNKGRYQHPKADCYAKYHPNKFREGHIFEEAQSVKWNKEKVITENIRIEALKKEYDEIGKNNPFNFRNDLVVVLMSEYELNEAQAKIVSGKAWEDGHSYGYIEVIGNAISLGEMAESIIKAASEIK